MRLSSMKRGKKVRHILAFDGIATALTWEVSSNLLLPMDGWRRLRL